MADDNLAAALDGIRSRYEQVRNGFGNVGGILAKTGATEDVPRLLAALDAVLARHVPKTDAVTHVCASHGMGKAFREGQTAAEWREMVAACPDCQVVDTVACAACDPLCPDDNEWPCADYLAISRALLPEAESTDA